MTPLLWAVSGVNVAIALVVFVSLARLGRRERLRRRQVGASFVASTAARQSIRRQVGPFVMLPDDGRRH